MYLQTIKNVMIARGYHASDLARMAGVTRAAVCKWFKTKDGICNVETRTLLRLAQGLNIPPEFLVMKIPDLSNLETRFLWDRLYPNMDSFVAALGKNQLPALARLVQVAGLYETKKIAGAAAMTLFPRYKKHIKPARRKILEALWPLYQ